MARGRVNRKRSRFTRCNQCRYAIRWLSFRGDWRMFDPKPVDGRTYPGTAAYPVENGTKRAWRVTELVEDLMGRLGCSRADAEEDVYAMPFYVLHACPPDPSKKKKEPPR